GPGADPDAEVERDGADQPRAVAALDAQEAVAPLVPRGVGPERRSLPDQHHGGRHHRAGHHEAEDGEEQDLRTQDRAVDVRDVHRPEPQHVRAHGDEREERVDEGQHDDERQYEPRQEALPPGRRERGEPLRGSRWHGKGHYQRTHARPASATLATAGVVSRLTRRSAASQAGVPAGVSAGTGAAVGVGAGEGSSQAWMRGTTDAPSPLAAATRFIEPDLMSPTAKMPGTVVSRFSGGSPSRQAPGGTSRPVSTKPLESRATSW